MQDYAEAMQLYRLAAAQGHAVAQKMLGDMFRSGEGVVRDKAEAVKWYRLAAAQGSANAHAWLKKMNKFIAETTALGMDVDTEGLFSPDCPDPGDKRKCCLANCGLGFRLC